MSSLLHLVFITLFPEQVKQFLLKGLIKKAFDNGLFKLTVLDLRSFSDNKHQRVDDYPFGHRQGMLLTASVIYNAITSIEDVASYRLLYTSPKGAVFNQTVAKQWLNTPYKGMIMLSGYYEGIDERVFDLLPLEQVSVGDMILTSGDLATLLIADVMIRQLDGVLGNSNCIADESIISGRLEAPQYTQPREYRHVAVPEVLINGDHKKRQQWQQEQSVKETLFKRSDLLATHPVSDEEKQQITTLLNHYASS